MRRSFFLILLLPLSILAQEFIYTSNSNVVASQKTYDNAINQYIITTNKKLQQTYNSDIVVRNKYVWQNTKRIAKRNWKGAERYCQQLNLTGFSDWYLPTKNELKTLIDSKRKPKLTKGFKNISSLAHNRFWTSSVNTSKSSKAWRIDFKTGNIKSQKKANKYYVRCVRQDLEVVQNETIEAKDLTQLERFEILTNYLATITLASNQKTMSEPKELVKGRYEKTNAFEKRVKAEEEKNKRQVDNNLISIMQRAYSTIYGRLYLENSLDYDADNEMFFGRIKAANGGFSQEVSIQVPINKAEEFENDLDALTIEVLFIYQENQLIAKEIIISDNKDAYLTTLDSTKAYVNEIVVPIEVTTSKPKSKIVDIECARIKKGKILQIYVGTFNAETQRIMIDGQDYSHKYIMGTVQTVRDALRIGHKMHICIENK